MRSVGILGLSGSGKTTLFEILVRRAGAPVGSDPRSQVGIVTVPDVRLDRLAEISSAKKTTHVQIRFVDSVAAGQGARAAARGPDLFSSVRECDALVAVVRDFESPMGPAKAKRDLDALETELILNDLVLVETRLERVQKELRVGKKDLAPEADLLTRCKQILELGRPLRAESLEPEEEKRLRGFQLLSLKPLLVVYNQDEHSVPVDVPSEPNKMSVTLRAELEHEVLALPVAERAAFRAAFGIADEGLTLVIRACYQLLGLISFFTLGPEETRAWTLQRGGRALDAAGEIHSDMAHGFIRAEVIGWQELFESGGKAEARARGLLRLEGREYEVRDGDCLEIRFNR